MMDMYAMTLLGLIALILLAVVAGAVYSVVSRKRAFNAVVAKNVAVKPLNRPLNYPDWKAKRDENHQRMKELNADFSAIISGE
jgi:uncharacterized protein YcfJ